MSLLKKLAGKKIVKKALPKKHYTEVEKEVFILDSEHSLLLAEACKLDKAKKKAEKRLKEIKETLNLKEKGEYSNKIGDKVNISVTEKFTDIEPKELFDHMSKKGLKNVFWTCVKVQMTPLKKIIPQTEIDERQVELDPIIKYSFK